MADFSAWDALVTGGNFMWYLVLAAVATGFGWSHLRKGWDELLGRNTGVAAPAPDAATKKALSLFEMQEARLAVRERLSPLHQTSEWRQGKTLAPLQIELIRQAFALLGGPELGGCADIPALRARLSGTGFRAVTGKQAQDLANRRKLVVAANDVAAGLVIPGNVGAGTPFGEDNPWVLWPGDDGLLEIQAVMVFGAQGRPDFLGLE